jgi:hypothetical protein
MHPDIPQNWQSPVSPGRFAHGGKSRANPSTDASMPVTFGRSSCPAGYHKGCKANIAFSGDVALKIPGTTEPVFTSWASPFVIDFTAQFTKTVKPYGRT